MAKAAKKKAAPKKGVAGKGTGPKARAAIRKAKARGATNKTIGAVTNRDEKTIAGIAAGDIKNPPSDLAPRVSKARSVKKKSTKKKSK